MALTSALDFVAMLAPRVAGVLKKALKVVLHMGCAKVLPLARPAEQGVAGVKQKEEPVQVGSPPGDSMPSLLVVVRHGERLDEADRKAWQELVNKHPELRADPPLTGAGWQQARAAGCKLREVFGSLGRSVSRMYSSPTSRTLSTAAGLAEELGIKEVTPAYHLNCCAAAHKYGVEHKGMTREPTKDTLGNISCNWPPMGDPKRINQLNDQRRDAFVCMLQMLAAGEKPGSTLVLVSHREGIFQLQDCLGLPKRRASYCGIAYLQYSHKTKSVSVWPMPQLQQEPEVMPAKAGSTLQAILASGKGRLLVHRNGEGQRNESFLWMVPGGDAGSDVVKDGELVTLCSVPQAAEGGAGEFVLVQCSDGRKGWLQLGFVHLPQEVTAAPAAV